MHTRRTGNEGSYLRKEKLAMYRKTKTLPINSVRMVAKVSDVHKLSDPHTGASVQAAWGSEMY